MKIRNTLGQSVPITYVKSQELVAEPLNAIIDCLREAGFPKNAESLYLVVPTSTTKNKEWQRFIREFVSDFDRQFCKLGQMAYQAANLRIFDVPVVWSDTAPRIRCGKTTPKK